MLSGGDYLLAEDIAKVEISDDFFFVTIFKKRSQTVAFVCAV